MLKISSLRSVPAEWTDPVLSAAEAKILLTQPYHILIGFGGMAENGHLLARVVPQTPADILTLFVHPLYRRQGHAQEMLNRLIEKAKNARCPAITLEVRASNQAARTLYETAGFQSVNLRKSYYANPVEDAVVYSYILR